MKVLEINNLTKYYGSVLGVKNLSLSLSSGEVFGFIGPNGSGKSTTIRCIMNLINKNEGTIKILGNIFTKDDIEIKKIIGYLPSEIYLYDDLIVKEMLDYHESFYDKDISKNRKRLVKLLKLDETKRIEDLSLGNLKKLGIVLALVTEPQILILDEPTSGLDPIMQNIFYDLILEEKKKGTTILYSTHVLSEVSRVCDRVGIIKDGNLIKVEDIKDMENKSLTFVTITSKDIEDIKKNINNDIIEIDSNTIKFSITDYNKLIKMLSKYNIEKILIEEATLEELFLHFYK